MDNEVGFIKASVGAVGEFVEGIVNAHGFNPFLGVANEQCRFASHAIKCAQTVDGATRQIVQGFDG